MGAFNQESTMEFDVVTSGKMAAVLLPVAMALGTSAASAQSSLQIYGVLNAGPVAGKFSPGVSRTFLSEGPYTVPRMGFRGSEDLGGGLSAGFQLEAGVNVHNGTGDGPGGSLAFTRGSQISLASRTLGEVTLGRMYMPAFWVYLAGDPGVGGEGLGSMGAMVMQQDRALTGQSGWGGFYDNALRYRSPRFAGLTSEVAYSLGAERSGAARKDGRMMGMNLQYNQADDGPLYLGAAYQKYTAWLPEAVGPQGQDRSQRSWMLAARYRFGPVALGANYGRASNSFGGAAGSTAACIGPGTPPSASGCHMRTFALSGRLDLTPASSMDLSVAQLRATSGRLAGARAYTLATGYTYHFSRRTWGYVQAVKMFNNAKAPWGLDGGLGGRAANGTPGFRPSAFSVGLMHSF